MEISKTKLSANLIRYTKELYYLLYQYEVLFYFFCETTNTKYFNITIPHEIYHFLPLSVVS